MREDDQYPSEDDFMTDEERKPGINWVRVFGTSTAIVILAGFAGGIWYAYDQGVKKGVQLAPPIIKADSAPVKIIPKDPGGMEIAHQEKKIFSVLKPEEDDQKTEKLMAPIEEATIEAPLVEAPKSLEKKEIKKTVEKLISKTEEVATKEPKMLALKKPEVVAEALEKPTLNAPVVAKQKTPPPIAKKVEISPAPVKKIQPPSGETKIYRVQLAAFKSKDAAVKLWTTLQKRHAELLGHQPRHIQSVEITGKGEFFRLQAGRFEDRTAALALCNKLKSEKQDCLIAGN